MEGCEWVIDTWVLETAENVEDDRCWSALLFLSQILENHCVAIDGKHEIVYREYERHISFRPPTHVAKWWTLICKRAGKINLHYKCLSKRHSEHLLQKLHFDRSDLKFVAVASMTEYKFLVSEDSHYSHDVKQYLHEELGITVFSVSDALAKAKDP